jgi:prepilin-type N-terminal cleavage/methylation domain-containing protein
MIIMKHSKGFTLLELIMTIVLIGIIATFTGFFIFSGINGYLRAQYVTNASLDAQRALDRISLELRDVTDITPTPNATSLTYQSEVLTGTRTLKYDANTDTIFIRVEPDDYVLLENVSSFNLVTDTYNLDADPLAVEEVRYIEVVFNLEDIGTNFRTRIFPRNLVTKTW